MRAILVLIVLVGIVGTPASAIHPNQPQGFDADRAVQRGLDQIDQVDLFSGRLSIALPLGPFALVYNSNIWRYEIIMEEEEERIRAGVDPQNTGGLGWRLDLGEVYRPQHPYNVTGRWLFVSDDGGRHVFYDTLHNDDDNAVAGVWYTRDGSYLRLTKSTSFYVDIEFPDGTTRRFLTGAATDPSVFRLHKVWSRFASADDPDLWVTRDAADLERTVHDRYGRRHTIRLTDEFAPRFPRTVTQVDIEAFGGDRLIYDFEYWDRWVDVSCKQSSVSSPNRIRVPHLKRIDNRGNDTAYTFTEDGALLYYNICQGGIEDLPGILRGINLPTGGKIRYVFQEYEFPPAESNSVFNSSAGVASRTLLNADDTPYGDGASTWAYKTTKKSAAETGEHPEMHTEVVNPTGDCSRHFFDAVYWRSTATGEGWERGLPFTYTQHVASPGSAVRYLSQQIFSTSDGAGSCAGDLLRSVYLRLRHDALPGPSAPLSDWTNLNRQVQASRVVFHDDAGRYADTEWSDFDGLGHFRRTVTTGSFRSDSKNSERREGFVAYDRVAGTYGTAGYEPPGTDEPWVLQTFGYTEVSEDDAFGESTARVEHDFEQASGFLTCTRTLTSGTERAANDVLQVFERNELGEVTDVKTYGGDRQILATGGEPCGSLPAQPAFWESHTYQFGVLESTRARTPAGEDGPFLLYDVDLDPSTGRVVKQRSPAGFEETFDYDLLGRLVAVTPLSGGRRTIDYTAVSANAPASSTTTIRGARGNGALVQQVVELDGFGYRRVERRSMPGGAWAERQIRRNARGWTTAVSEWGATDKATEVLVFSPFGRPKTIQLPSGPGHEVGLSYQGDRRVTRQAAVALSGGEAPVSRMLEYDRYNRLRSVEEPSGPAGETVTTTYDYDVAGRLTRMTSGGVSGQVRTFEYDNRGFLLAETHPEKGVGGVTYHDHDARGLAGRQQDGPHDLAMTYDLLGRLLTVRDRSQGQRLVKELEYDTAPGFGLGRLASAARINYVDLPWNSAGEEAVRVEQAYRYEGLGGAPSSRTTSFLDWDQGAIAFEQSAVYDDLGRITQLTYPGCTVGVCSAVGNGRQIDRTYDQGLLTAVAGWATAIDYHSSGLWQRTAHANGVIDHQAQDPDFTGRPLRISTSEAKPLLANFDSGDLAFDDAGNLKAMGGEAFVYDEASRLRQATALDGHWTRAYSYDTFGNLAGTTTDDHGDVESRVYAVDPATNRLVDGSYDAAGNLTAWQGATFTYDTANRLTRQAWMTYLYDASGERVAAIPNVGPGFVTVQFHLRDLSHRLLSRWALVNGEWRHDRDYIYAEDRVLGRVETTSAGVEVAYHHHLDHLGSLRLTTRADGSRHFEHHLLPYGEEWTGGVGASNEEPMLFAGHERDFSVGTDSMHARHYFPALGRFLSTDPAPGDFTAPLSWNRYTYALSNPLTYVDPDGRAAEKPWKKAPPGFLGVFVWTFTSSPVAWLEKTAFFSVAATAAVPAAVALDVLVNPLRLIPEVDRKVTRSLGNRPFPITREVAAAFYDGYVEAVGLPFDLSWLQEELDAIGRVGPTVAGDRSWWRSLGVNNVSDGKIGPEQSLFCGAQTCVEVNGVPFEIQQEVIAHQLAAQDSVASLDLFRCMLSPTSCFAVLTGGGGGRPSGGLWDLYY